MIYFFHDERYPLMLLSIYAKGAKDDLSSKERRELAGLVSVLKRDRRVQR